jgi:hypothetical protein
VKWNVYNSHSTDISCSVTWLSSWQKRLNIVNDHFPPWVDKSVLKRHAIKLSFFLITLSKKYISMMFMIIFEGADRLFRSSWSWSFLPGDLSSLWMRWLSNLLIMSASDEGYSRNPSCALNYVAYFCY